MERELISTSTAAKMTGYHVSYFSKLAQQGRIEAIRPGREWLLYKDSLEKFMQEWRKPGPKGPRKPRERKDHTDVG